MKFDFFENKKGVSAVITSVMLIALTFIAIGVIWISVTEIAKGRADDATDQENCVGINLEVLFVDESCDNTLGCNVTLRRRAGGGNMTGVKAVFGDGSSYSGPISEEINIEPLETYVLDVEPVEVVIENPNEIEVTPYIIGIDGSEILCDKVSYRFK